VQCRHADAACGGPAGQALALNIGMTIKKRRDHRAAFFIG
jgi:hypothetical protein